jgi:hypothetical protein
MAERTRARRRIVLWTLALAAITVWSLVFVGEARRVESDPRFCAEWRIIAETAGHREHRDLPNVDCLSCHASSTHAAEAPEKAYLSCHEDQRLHKSETALECKNCHQAHRFDVPTCASCHKDIATKGLHAVAQHAADCNNCHDPHVESLPTRERCLACHTDRTNHEPAAKQCNTCHIFK